MKNNFMDMLSMIKATCAFTAALFIFTGCGGGGDTAATAYATPTSSLTPELESTPPQTSSNSSLKITSIEEQQTTDVATTIAWELTEQATGHIEYGFDTSYGDITIKEESFDFSTHIQTLSDLEPNSIYHYRIISEDADGNRVVSDDRIFKTKSDGTVSLEPSTTTPAPDDEGTTTVPDGATVITGLKTEASLAAAKNNSNVLNAVLAGGGKNLVIPSGIWYTYDTVYVNKDTTLSFKGKLQQLKDSTNYDSAHRHAVRTRGSNIILNNPRISQKGINHPHGTNSSLALYGGENIIVNGGILEHGAANSLQVGTSNTVFNGTIFRDSVEHLIYASGSRNEPDGVDMRPDGLTFNNCIMERPGNGLTAELEANHIQIRHYKNVEINNCIIQGKKKTSPSQFGILATGVQGLRVNDTTISDYSGGLLYAGSYDGRDTRDVVFTNVTATPASGNIDIVRGTRGVDITFNNLDITSPLSVNGNMNVIFNDSTFRLTKYFMRTRNGATATFNNQIWDASASTYSIALQVDVGTTANFTGTQTKIAPLDGHSLDWGPLQE